jgi:fructoselysine 6-phosphate deglycase
MSQLQANIDRAKESLYFSGARIDEHLDTFMRAQRDLCSDLADGFRSRHRQLFLVGSGGSFASMQTASYLLDGVLDVPVAPVASYELLWRQHVRLDSEALVVLASYSGETEDTVAALRRARSCGARTVAIVGKAKSTMAFEADVVIPYDSGAIFEVPIVAMIMFAAAAAEGTPAAQAARDLDGALDALPDLLRRSLDAEERRAEGRARALLYADHLYVLGGGPLSPLAYKLAMSVVMENVRIGATYSDAAEWRHGPAEALERLRAPFVVLLGTDASRSVTQRTLEFCVANGSDVHVYDAADFGELHPLLTPLVMNSHTQWLVVYSAILRGITDLDERVFMGHGVLATEGAQWP